MCKDLTCSHYVNKDKPMLKTVEEIVEAVGGNLAAAALAGVSAPAISNWKARRQIPADQYLVFTEALNRAGKQADPAVFSFATDQSDEMKTPETGAVAV